MPSSQHRDVPQMFEGGSDRGLIGLEPLSGEFHAFVCVCTWASAGSVRVSVTGLGLGLALSPPLQRRHPIPCSVQNPTCPGFYLHQCQTRSHPSCSSRRPGLAASGSRGSTPLESPPLSAPGRRCRQSQRPRVLKLPVASSLVPALLSPHPLIPLQTSEPTHSSHCPDFHFGPSPVPQGAASQL